MVEVRRNQPVKLYGDGHRVKWKGRVLISGGEGRNHTSMPIRVGAIWQHA